MDNDNTIYTDLFKEKGNLLIDRFMLIGYKSDKIVSLIKKAAPNISKKIKGNNDECYMVFELEKYPKILSDICPSHNKEVLSRDIIFKYLFPCKPSLYIIRSSFNDTLTPEMIKEKLNYSQIFSHYSSEDDTTYYGFVHILYERIIEQDANPIFGPKFFFFLSKYSYFNTFYNITHHFNMLFKKSQTDIPLEFIIYNLVAFTPSPLGKKYNLIIDGSMKEKPLIINHLLGYPYLQFNLFSLFYVFPPKVLLELFLFIFIEEKVILYAENLMLLNFLMYGLVSLCFPCNDSPYYKNIKSISYTDFIDSKEYNRSDTYIIGINSSKVNSDDISIKIGAHFEINIDNKTIEYCIDPCNDDMDYVEQIKSLQNFIQFIIEKIPNKTNFFEQIIHDLYKELELTSKKIAHHMNNQSLFISSDLFDEKESYRLNNTAIQECFYHFQMNIFKEFYNNSSINSQGPLIKSYEKELIKTTTSPYYISFPMNSYQHETLFFIDKIKVLKFKKYILDEYSYNNTFKTNKAILYELINWKCLYSNNESISDNCLSTIESALKFYDKKFHSFLDFDFLTFENYYRKNLSQYFYKALYDSSIRSVDKISKKNVYKYNAKLIEFDNTVLLKYSYWIQSLTQKQLNDIFVLLPEIVKSTSYPQTSLGKISDLFERVMIFQKAITKESMILFSFLYFFTLTRTICERESFPQFEIINNEIFNKKISGYYINKYITFLLNIYSRIIRRKYLNQRDNVKEISIYCSITFSMLLSQHIPDEELMILLNQFQDLNENHLYENKNEIYESLPEIIEWKISLNNIQFGKTSLNEEFFVSQSDLGYDGNITLDNELHPPQIVLVINNTQTFITNIYSTLKLYNHSKKMFKDFFPKLNIQPLNKEIMKEICVNLLFYINNMTKLKFNREKVVTVLLRIFINIDKCIFNQ